MTDAVAIQLITQIGTIATVLLTGYFNRRATKDKAEELHKRFDALAQRDSGAHSLAEFQALAAADIRRSDRELRTPLQNDG